MRWRWAAYIWAAPTTALGLGVGVIALLSNGRFRVCDGVIEVHGGVLKLFLTAIPLSGGIAAMTLGHVVVGRDGECLRQTRAHERVHVRQCERWGPFFLPAYLLASGWAVLRGGHAYHDNCFERQAVREVPPV